MRWLVADAVAVASVPLYRLEGIAEVVAGSSFDPARSARLAAGSFSYPLWSGLAWAAYLARPAIGDRSEVEVVVVAGDAYSSFLLTSVVGV